MTADQIWFRPAPRPATVPAAPERPASAPIELEIDGRAITAPEGSTILDACRAEGIETPTLCYLENLTPVNVCRVCVVELEGARVLAPACSRKVEAGMKVATDSERVRTSRKLVLELLGSTVDLSTAPEVAGYMARYGADPNRFGPPAPPAAAGERDTRLPGEHEAPEGHLAATVAQPVKVDNELYVRDYAKCILCYKCVEACGVDAQNTFAIGVAGRGFDARISTEWNVGLPDSACVYCGNCIGVCPTGALMFRSEHEMRAAGTWDASGQTLTDTICPYCGVGCTLTLHVQDNEIVKVTSPLDVSITNGHLCVKGRFGFQFVQERPRAGVDPCQRRTPSCILCRIVADELPASFVHRGATATAFMDINPVTTGHLLVVPNRHYPSLADAPVETFAHVMRIARRIAVALRVSSFEADGINLFLADGEVAGQEVPHLHVHVIPRTPNDGFRVQASAWDAARPAREALDQQAEAIKAALGHGT